MATFRALKGRDGAPRRGVCQLVALAAMGAFLLLLGVELGQHMEQRTPRHVLREQQSLVLGYLKGADNPAFSVSEAGPAAAAASTAARRGACPTCPPAPECPDSAALCPEPAEADCTACPQPAALGCPPPVQAEAAAELAGAEAGQQAVVSAARANPGAFNAELEEAVTVWTRLRDGQQQDQAMARRIQELTKHIHVMTTWDQQDQATRGGWESKTPVPDLQRELDTLTASRAKAASGIVSLLAAHDANMAKLPAALGTIAGQAPTARLNPRLYPDRPKVSFLVNYFKRPWAVEGIVKEFSACKHALPSELLVNVDSPDEAAEWVKHVYPSEGFVVPVFSYNLHETRGYNRIAGMARGDVLVLLQDDKLPPGDNCTWALDLMRVFDKYPSLGGVGLNYAQLTARAADALVAGPDTDFKRQATPELMLYEDLELRQPMQFVLRADFSPYAMRRDAFMDVGGLDETYGHRGECGIGSDFDVSLRLWSAGWQVAHLPFASRGDGQEGGTHKAGGVADKCWGKNLELALFHFGNRFSTAQHLNLSQQAMDANAKYLHPKS